MTRNLGMMAGLLVLAACGEKGGQDAGKPAAGDTVQAVAPAEPLVVGATEIIPEKKCDGDPIGKPLIILLTNQMLKQLSLNDQEIVRKVTRGGNDTYPPELNDKKLYPTNLDLPADGVGTNPGDHVLIQIKLQPANAKKRDLIFVRMDASAEPADGDNSAGAVTVRHGDSGKFCGRLPIKRDPVTDEETLTFGSLLKKEEESSINIGVLVANKKDTTKWTPIYIDPNVRNQG
jgi:hypothetical protein